MVRRPRLVTLAEAISQSLAGSRAGPSQPRCGPGDAEGDGGACRPGGQGASRQALQQKYAFFPPRDSLPGWEGQSHVSNGTHRNVHRCHMQVTLLLAAPTGVRTDTSCSGTFWFLSPGATGTHGPPGGRRPLKQELALPPTPDASALAPHLGAPSCPQGWCGQHQRMASLGFGPSAEGDSGGSSLQGPILSQHVARTNSSHLPFRG